MHDGTPDLAAVPGSIPVFNNVDTALAYWRIDILWVMLVHGGDTGGRYSLIDEALPQGSGAPPHKHTWSDEHLFIMAGEITFPVGNEIRKGAKGDFVFVPRNTRHAFRIDSDTAAFLTGYTPVGLQPAVAELAMPAATLTVPPKCATPPLAVTSELMGRYGMDNARPNPLDNNKKART